MEDSQKIVGGTESQVVVGAALYTITGNMRAYALTCRVTGTVIAVINVQDRGGVARAYAPTWSNIILNQGDYFVSQFPIVSIQLTAATDSVTLHCNRPY